MATLFQKSKFNQCWAVPAVLAVIISIWKVCIPAFRFGYLYNSLVLGSHWSIRLCTVHVDFTMPVVASAYIWFSTYKGHTKRSPTRVAKLHQAGNLISTKEAFNGFGDDKPRRFESRLSPTLVWSTFPGKGLQIFRGRVWKKTEAGVPVLPIFLFMATSAERRYA